jgi:hypothetical protein
MSSAVIASSAAAGRRQPCQKDVFHSEWVQLSLGASLFERFLRHFGSIDDFSWTWPRISFLDSL